MKCENECRDLYMVIEAADWLSGIWLPVNETQKIDWKAESCIDGNRCCVERWR